MNSNEVLFRLRQVGVVPVVVFDKLEDAMPTAKALLAGGVDTMEITLRTEHGIPSIKKISQELPDMLVGAGTVLNLEQAKKAVEAGAKYIVSPGLDEEVVKWCVSNDIAVSPGCVTPSEVQKAINLGLKTVKFFPASVYGGIKTIKALSGPFVGITFMPTGGVDLSNIQEYASEKCIWAIGGGWLCNPTLVKNGEFDKITEIAKKSINSLLNFQIEHVGINNDSKDESLKNATKISELFDITLKEGNSSNFVGTGIELNNHKGYGEKGHIAISTNNMDSAMYHLSKKGVKFIEETKTNAIVYLQDEIGGFAYHLKQK